jgi:hypothetical protein
MYVCMYVCITCVCVYVHTHARTRAHTHTLSSRFSTRHKDYAACICKLCCYWSWFTRGISHFFESKVIRVNNSYISDVVYQLLLWRFILESSEERDALCGLYSTNTGQNWINILVFWAMTACSVVNGCQRIGRTYCLHLGQVMKKEAAGSSAFLRSMSPCRKRHDLTDQRRTLLLTAAVKTSSLNFGKCG